MRTQNRSTRIIIPTTSVQPSKHYRTTSLTTPIRPRAIAPAPVVVPLMKPREFVVARNPSIDKKQRHRMSDDQLSALEELFECKTHPTKEEKRGIADELGLDVKTVTIWLQNKRQTVKRGGPAIIPRRTSKSLPTYHSSSVARPLYSSPSEHTSTQDSSSSDARSGLSGVTSPSRNVTLATKVPPPSFPTRSKSTVPYRPPLTSTSPSHSNSKSMIQDLQDASTHPVPSGNETSRLGSAQILPRELWEHILSSPPSTEESPYTSPDRPSIMNASDLMSIHANSNVRKLTLDWVCERETRRWHANRRENGDDSETIEDRDESNGDKEDSSISSDHASLQHHPPVSGLSLLCLAATCQEIMLDASQKGVDRDVVCGAAMLLGLKHSIPLGRVRSKPALDAGAIF